ncbi:MAG: GNAT family N-acetyltransferase [Bacteroidales bacterium]|nr:GNAT family N-acetyltransferase [Bacteroidales bacterium]
MDNLKLYFNQSIDIALISETFEKAFNQKFNQKSWEWRFLENPNDDKIFISYIIEDGKLAAYYAVSPATINYNGRKLKIALSNMTMTHPDFQGKGYFKLLANSLYAKLKENNYIGVFGFANTNSHYGFRKYLNWHDLAMLNIFKTTTESFRPFLIKDNDLLNFEELPLNQETVKLLRKTTVSENKIEVNRDLENYLWRFVKIPEKEYQLLITKNGDETLLILVYKFFGNEIDIMEIFNTTPQVSVSQQLLGCAIKHLVTKYESSINIWSNLYDDVHLYLEKIGFQESVFNTYFGFIPFNDNKEFLDIKNWHFRLYDSDIF